MARVQRAVIGGAVGVCLVAGARAEEPLRRIRLAWSRGDGAEHCPDEPALRARVRERLGRDPFADDAPLSIDGSVTREGNQWRADLRIRDAAQTLLGVRKLDNIAEECEPLAEAVVLALALTIDPNGRTPTPGTPAAAFPPESVPVAAPAPLATPAPAAPSPSAVAPQAPAIVSERARTPSPRATAELDVIARAGVAGGVLPGAAPVIELSGAYGRDPVRFTMGASVLPEQRTADGRFAFSLASGSAGVCLGRRFAHTASAHLCAAVEAGALRATVLDVEELRPLDQGNQPWVAITAGPRLSWSPVSPLRLEAGVRAVGPIVRKSFKILEASEPIFESSAVGAVGYVGIGLGVP